MDETQSSESSLESESVFGGADSIAVLGYIRSVKKKASQTSDQSALMEP
jgi:hypothetical protein